MFRVLPVLLVMALAPACGRPGQAPPDTPAEVPAGFEGAPAGAVGIAGLLRARHTEDLPGRETLDAHPDPVASLAWLAGHASTAAVKIRAVRALGTHYPGEQGELLAGFAADAPAPLRAAALRALADWPVETRSAHAEVLRGGLGDADPRVDEAAQAALTGLPSGPDDGEGLE